MASSSVVLASAGYDHTIRFWEATSGCCYRTLQYAESQVNKLEITADKTRIAAAGNPQIRVFDVNSPDPNPLLSYDGHAGNVTAVGFHKDGKWMFTGACVAMGRDPELGVYERRGKRSEAGASWGLGACHGARWRCPFRTCDMVRWCSPCVTSTSTDSIDCLLPLVFCTRTPLSTRNPLSMCACGTQALCACSLSLQAARTGRCACGIRGRRCASAPTRAAPPSTQ